VLIYLSGSSNKLVSVKLCQVDELFTVSSSQKRCSRAQERVRTRLFLFLSRRSHFAAQWPCTMEIFSDISFN